MSHISIFSSWIIKDWSMFHCCTFFSYAQLPWKFRVGNNLMKYICESDRQQSHVTNLVIQWWRIAFAILFMLYKFYIPPDGWLYAEFVQWYMHIKYIICFLPSINQQLSWLGWLVAFSALGLLVRGQEFDSKSMQINFSERALHIISVFRFQPNGFWFLTEKTEWHTVLRYGNRNWNRKP